MGVEELSAAEAEPDGAVSVILFQLSETVTVHGLQERSLWWI